MPKSIKKIMPVVDQDYKLHSYVAIGESNNYPFIAKYDNIMPYIHLPLQSGSDRILKLMGRRYTKEKYLDLFNKIKLLFEIICS